VTHHDGNVSDPISDSPEPDAIDLTTKITVSPLAPESKDPVLPDISSKDDDRDDNDDDPDDDCNHRVSRRMSRNT